MARYPFANRPRPRRRPGGGQVGPKLALALTGTLLPGSAFTLTATVTGANPPVTDLLSASVTVGGVSVILSGTGLIRTGTIPEDAEEGQAIAAAGSVEAGGQTISAARNAVVAGEPVAPPLAGGGISDQEWTVGVAVNLNVAADFTGAGITYALAPSSSALPAGLSLSAAGVISGTPTAEATGTIVVRGTNSGGYADTAFGFAVAEAGGVVLTQNVRVLCVGDSTFVGVGASPVEGSDYAGSRPFSVPVQAAVALNAAGVPASANTMQGNNNVADLALYRDDMEVIGTTQTSTRSPTAGGILYRFAAGNGLSITPDVPVDTLVLGYPRAAAFGSIIVTVDGTVLTTVSQLPDTAEDFHFTTITLPSLGVHTISLTGSGTIHGPAFVNAYDSTQNQVHIVNAGARNWTTTNWIAATYPVSPLPGITNINPDILVIDIGINDYRQPGATIATVEANIQSMINAAPTATPILVVPNPIGTYNTTTDAWSQEAVLAMYQRLAAANAGSVLVNSPEVYFEAGLSGAVNPATFAALNTAGHMSDTLHPKAPVYAAEGAAIAEAIQSVIAARGWIAA